MSRLKQARTDKGLSQTSLDSIDFRWIYNPAAVIVANYPVEGFEPTIGIKDASTMTFVMYDDERYTREELLERFSPCIWLTFEQLRDELLRSMLLEGGK